MQVESYEDEEVLIEYTLANPTPFKDVVECVVNDEKVTSNQRRFGIVKHQKLKICLQNKTTGYAVVLIVSIIGVLSFVIGTDYG